MKHETSPQVAITVRNGNMDGALRVFKKRLQEDGLTNELRKRDHFISKGEKRRQSKKSGRRREQREIQKRLEEFGF
jgi:ribosomal protein S21